LSNSGPPLTSAKCAIGLIDHTTGELWPEGRIWVHREIRIAGPPPPRAAAECQKWLAELARGPKKYTRSEYLRQAKARWPSLAEDRFDAAWAKEVPAEWRKAGRPKSNPSCD
jgi:hypothetical protein